MMKRSVIILLVAVGLIVTGFVLAGCGFIAMDFDLTAIDTSQNLVTATDSVTESFTNLDIENGTLDVSFLPSDDGTCRYVATTYNNMFCDVTVQNGTLIIRQNDARAWYEHFGIYWGRTSLEIYLPESSYGRLVLTGNTGCIRIPADFSFETALVQTDTGDVEFYAAATETLDIESDTGDIQLVSIETKALTVKSDTGICHIRGAAVQDAIELKTSTGDITLIDATCGTLSIKTDTGDAELENVVASGDAVLTSSTGDLEFFRFDGAQIRITTDTGDVEGTLLSEKIFFTDTTTGDVDVPRSTSGGKCEITTDTGDIEIEIAP